MAHPDAQIALLSGASGITGHFGSAPFQYDELKDPRARKVLDSYDVLGGPHTFNAVWATTKFATDNPRIVRAFVDALADCMKFIAKDPRSAAEIWIKAEKSKLSIEDAEKLIRLPENEWTMTPKKVTVYAEFMHRTGVLATKPADWKEIFFDVIHDLPGS
jgi:NitT/TauT family transport system substrate-binding protein